MPAKNVKAKFVIEIGNERYNFEKDHTSLLELKERINSYLDTLLMSELKSSYSEAKKQEDMRGIFEPVEPEFLPAWVKDYDMESLTQKEKVMLLIKNERKNEWIKSQELKEKYKEVFGENMKLSSISTYLARFHEEGLLERKGSRAQREYKFSGVAIP